MSTNRPDDFPPAGWYRNSDGIIEWWDGAEWTAQHPGAMSRRFLRPLIAAFGISAVVPPVLFILSLVGAGGAALLSIAFPVSMIAVVGLLVASARLWFKDREPSS